MLDYKNRENNWYSLETAEVITRLDTDREKGLSETEARERMTLLGENELPRKRSTPGIIKFLKQFNDILIYVLLLAAVITAVLGHYVDTIVILLVTIINALIGYIQENKAEKALENIKNMLSPKAQVVRDGERKEIDSKELTVGDVVLLAPGDKVPADIRLTETNNLQIEESVLTGESVPAEKCDEVLEEGTVLGNRCNMAFSSTTVSAGTGAGVVIAIGADTELGKINQLISETQTLTTPLLRQTARLGKTISIAIVVIAVLVYLFGYFFRDYSPQELLLSVIGLAVAAIPEGLPAILSIILAIGVQNMARKNAIIRNLPSVETLGAVSVICSDKTGTLTKNEMTVKTLVVKEQEYEVTGSGYAPEGDILLDGRKIDPNKEEVLQNLINCFEFCNDSSIRKDETGNWVVNGDPTEDALITLYEKAHLRENNIEK
ncbi:MAG: HAD-IC family P-type ATPase [Bacteroides sp.]|nr:HAD-IC family P-type ATPase [Bacteroides sp.]